MMALEAGAIQYGVLYSRVSNAHNVCSSQVSHHPDVPINYYAIQEPINRNQRILPQSFLTNNMVSFDEGEDDLYLLKASSALLNDLVHGLNRLLRRPNGQVHSLVKQKDLDWIVNIVCRDSIARAES
jgi:hypothetical protein